MVRSKFGNNDLFRRLVPYKRERNLIWVLYF